MTGHRVTVFRYIPPIQCRPCIVSPPCARSGGFTRKPHLTPHSLPALALSSPSLRQPLCGKYHGPKKVVPRKNRARIFLVRTGSAGRPLLCVTHPLAFARWGGVNRPAKGGTVEFGNYELLRGVAPCPTPDGNYAFSALCFAHWAPACHSRSVDKFPEVAVSFAR